MEYFTSIEKLSAGGWRFSWDATSGVSYEVWFAGTLLDTVDEGEYDCEIGEWEGTEYAVSPPPLEVVEEGTDPESELYPPFMILQWKGILDAAFYLIEEYVDSVATTRKTLEELGKEYYKHQTPMLDDCEVAEWDVTALNETGAGGTPVNLEKLIVRNPDPPDVEFSYSSSTGDVTVSEA